MNPEAPREVNHENINTDPTTKMFYEVGSQLLNDIYPQKPTGFLTRFKRNKNITNLVLDTGTNHKSMLTEAEKVITGNSTSKIPKRIILSGTRLPDGNFSKIRILSGYTETYFQGRFKRDYNITIIKNADSELVANIYDNTGTFSLEEYVNSSPIEEFKQLVKTFSLIHLKQSQKTSERREQISNGL